MPTRESTGNSSELALSESAWTALAEILDAFSVAWEQAPPIPELATHVPPPEHALRRIALVELVKIDLDHRSKHPEHWQILEWYSQIWPELVEQGQMPADLVYEEYQIRRRQKGTPDLQNYELRFPGVFTSLTRMIKEDTQLTSSIYQAKDRLEFKPGDKVDDFDLLTRLGSGAFATVFLARQNSMQRLVALKISADKGMEPQTLAQLDHPHIVRVFDHRVIDLPPVRLMYMQYVPGGTLYEILGDARELAEGAPPSGKTLVLAVDRLLKVRGENVPIQSENRRWLSGATWAQVVCHFGNQIVQALDYAHRQGVLHRDLKPANVLLDADCNLKLVDFNISFSSKLDGATPAAYFGGSLAYMSPEQLEACSPACARRPDELDGRSDIYSLGVMLYEMLEAKRPFQEIPANQDWGLTMQSMIDSRRRGISSEADQKLDSQPVLLAQSIRRCLAGNEWNRFETKAPLIRQLTWGRNAKSEELLKLPQDVASRFAARYPGWTAALLTVLISLAGVAFIFNYNLYQSVPEEFQNLFQMIMFANNFVMFPLGIVIIYLLTQPISTVLRRSRRSLSNTTEQLNTAIRRNWNIGHYVAIVAAAEWILAGVLFPTALTIGGVPMQLGGWMDFIVSHVMAGLVTGTYVFWTVSYFALRVWHPELILISLQHDSVEDWSRKYQLMQSRLTYYQILAVGGPMLSVALLVLLRFSHDISQFALLIVSGVALGGLALLAWTYRRIQSVMNIIGQLESQSDYR